MRGTNSAIHLWSREQVEAVGAWERIDAVACFALPPTCHGTDVVPVYATETNETVLSLTPPAPNAHALFVGLPLLEREPGSTLEGSWEFRAVAPDGEEFKFTLSFLLKGEAVQIDDLGQDTTGSGTFRDGHLTLTLRTEDGTYVIEGRLYNRTLAGSWRQEGASAKGTWSATLVDSTPAERHSPALTILREYHRLADGGKVYSTESQPPAGCAPNGRSLCRVWKAPGSVLVLDWKARHLAFSTN